MKTTSSLKTKARTALAGGLIALTSFLPGCGVNRHLSLIDKESISKPYVETALVSDYVARDGAMVEGQVRQDLLYLNLNKHLSAFIWQNHSYEEGEFNERDFGMSYNQPLTDKLSVSAGYQYWSYPSGTFGDYDHVMEFNANYSNKLDLRFDITQLLHDHNTNSGTRYYLKASKSFSLGEIKGCNVTLTPSISTGAVNDYYGRSGHSQITPGVNLGFNRENLGVNLFFNNQHGIGNYHDKNWSGINAGWSF